MQRFMAVRVPSARVYEYALHLSKALHDGADVGLEGTVFGARLRTVMAVVGESLSVVVATCERSGSEMGATGSRLGWKAGGTKRGRRWVRRVWRRGDE